MINPTSIEGELRKNDCLEKYAHKIRNWNEDKQEKFLDKHRYYKHRKVNKFLKMSKILIQFLLKKRQKQ